MKLLRLNKKECTQHGCRNSYVCSAIQVVALLFILSMSLNSQTYDEKTSTEILINSNPSTSTNKVSILSPTGLTTHTFTLPASITDGALMETDGNASTSWTEVNISVAGNDGEVQFNTGGFGSSASFYWNNSSTFLGVAVSSPSYTLENNNSMRTGRDGTDGELIITQGDYNISFIANTSMTTTQTFSLPPDDGAGLIGLFTDGSGELSWSGTVNYGPTGEGDIIDNTIGGGVTGGYIGGGDDNTIEGSADNSSIGGGHDNTIGGSASNSGMVGGNENNISGSASNSVILGSDGSNISGSASSSGILGGDNNNIDGSATNSVIMGGKDGNIEGSALNSAVFAGDGCSVEGSANNSIIAGGKDNSIESGATKSGLIGGRYNTVASNATLSFLGGGENNQIDGANSALIGGDEHYISSAAERSMIGGSGGSGVGVTVGADDSGVIGARELTLNSSYSLVAVLAGYSNSTSGSGSKGFLGAGHDNTLSNVDNSAIIAGFDLGINSGGDNSLLLGGDNNTVSDPQAAIIGGEDNLIQNDGNNSVILGGKDNEISEYNSVIFGGRTNIIENASNNANSGILGGRYHDINGQYDAVLYGRYSDINSGANYSLTGGWYGIANASNDYQVVLAGKYGTADNDGVWVMTDYQSNSSKRLTGSTAHSWNNRFASGYHFYTSADKSTGMTMTTGLSAWTGISDSSKKEFIVKYNSNEIYNKLKKLKISSWQYKGYDKRNYGPMAQDFFALFGKDKYGQMASDTTINGHDLSSVFILGVQGLKNKIEKHTQEIYQLRKKSDIIGKDINAVSRKISAIENKIAQFNTYKAVSNK